MRNALPSVLAMCVALAACEQASTTSAPSADEVARARSVTQLEITSQMPARLFAGMTVPVAFRALDASNQPVAGVVVRFNAVQMSSSSVRDAEAATDSAGVARTEWTLGTTAGQYQLGATVAYGTASRTIGLPITEGIADPPRFTQRTVTLPGPICAAELEISGSRSSAISRSGIISPAVLGDATIRGRTGTTSWMFVGFYAVAPGVGKVVTNDIYGRADTATVTVGNALPVVTLPDTLRMAVGDSTFPSPAIGGPCTSSLVNPLISTGFYIDTVQFRAASLAPDVFRSEQRRTGSRPLLRGVKAGMGRVVVTFWGGVDTAVVVVR